MMVGGIQGAGIGLIIAGAVLPMFVAGSILEYLSYAFYVAGALMIDITRYIYRGKIAAKYGIKFGPCPDYGLVCCCPQCSLVQETKVAQSGGGGGGGGGQVIGNA